MLFVTSQHVQVKEGKRDKLAAETCPKSTKIRDGKVDYDLLVRVISLRLHPFIQREVQDPHIDEDVLQETLLAMFQRYIELRCTKNFWGWIHRIALNN